MKANLGWKGWEGFGQGIMKPVQHDFASILSVYGLGIKASKWRTDIRLF